MWLVPHKLSWRGNAHSLFYLKMNTDTDNDSSKSNNQQCVASSSPTIL
jgi:hypothetical protein